MTLEPRVEPLTADGLLLVSIFILFGKGDGDGVISVSGAALLDESLDGVETVLLPLMYSLAFNLIRICLNLSCADLASL